MSGSPNVADAFEEQRITTVLRHTSLWDAADLVAQRYNLKLVARKEGLLVVPQMRLNGWSESYDGHTGISTTAGSACYTFDGMTVYGDTLRWDIKAKTIEAIGDVVVIKDEAVHVAEAALLDLPSGALMILKEWNASPAAGD